MHKRKPDYLNPKATYHFEDIRKENVLAKHLRDADVVVHAAGHSCSSRAGRAAARRRTSFPEFKQVLPTQIMEELDNLVWLDWMLPEQSGPKAFVKAADVPRTTRYRVTDRGKKIAESPKGEEIAIEEIM